MFDPFDGSTKRPTLGCDSVILTKRKMAGSENEEWFVLLIERGHDPYKGKWAFPGGFLEWGESCEQGAARELEEETSLKNVDLKLLGVFSNRVAILADRLFRFLTLDLLNRMTRKKQLAEMTLQKQNGFPLNQMPELAFDHADILEAAKTFLKSQKG